MSRHESSDDPPYRSSAYAHDDRYDDDRYRDDRYREDRGRDGRGRGPARRSAPRRRRGRAGRVLLVTLLLLAVLVVIADRGGARLAGRLVADEVAASAADYGATREDTAVTVHGVPFLTQVVEGRYRDIDVTMEDLGQQGVRIDRLTVQAGDVRVAARDLLAGDTSDVRADRVTGRALVTWTDLAAASGLPGVVLAAEGTEVRVVAPLSAVGVTAQLSGLASVSLVEGQIRIDVRDVSLSDVSVPQQVVDAAAARLAQTIAVPPLPYDLQLRSIEVTPEGVVATATGEGVSLTG